MEHLKEIKDFKERFLKTVLLERKGNSYNQWDLLDMIEGYWDSNFWNGDQRDELFAFFYNVVKLPVRVAAKMIDLDTKDFRFMAEEGQSQVPIYFLNKELKNWMKEKGFNSTLNRIVKQTPKYGNTVLKIMKDDVKPVRLRNLVCDPTVEKLEDSIMVIEEHEMSLSDLLKMKDKWENVDMGIQWFKEHPEESYLVVSEVYMFKPKSFWKGEESSDEELVRGVYVIGNLEEEKGQIEFAREKKDLPYFEFFWDEYQGRWLRTGIVEELLEEQMATNEVVYLEMKNLYWNSKKLFQTRDTTSHKNLLKDVPDGQLLRMNSEITPVAMEERNQGNFNSIFNIWTGNVQNKSMSFDTVSGKQLPSATPFRSVFLQQSAAAGHFDFQREDIGILLRKLVFDIIAPMFVRSHHASHTYNFIGEDDEFASYEEMFVNSFMHKKVRDMIKKGKAPTPEQVESARQNALKKLRSKPNRKIEIPEGYYEDLKFKVDVVVTNEQVDIDAKLQSMVTILQTISTNPGILQNDVTKRILFRILDLAGISPEELRGQAKAQGEIPAELLQRFSPPPGQVSPELQTGQQQATF